MTSPKTAAKETTITMVSPALSSRVHLSVRQYKAELPTQRVNNDAYLVALYHGNDALPTT